MKRGILVLLFIFLLACSVNAMTVELVSPSDGNVSTDIGIVLLTCKATVSGDELLDNLTWVYSHNESSDYFTKTTHSYEGLVSGTAVGYGFSGLINATYTWTCLAVSNDSVETWASSNYTFIVTFTTATAPSNNPPTCVVENTNVTVNEDSGSWTLDANMTKTPDTVNISCLDSDSNALTYSIGSQTGSGGTFSLSNNDVLNFATDANATGTKVAIISVSDGTNTIQISAQVVVSAINDPPLVSVISNQTWNQGSTKTISLGEYFSDVDDSSLNYSYSFTSSSPININVTIEDDSDAVFTPENSWYGSETITFTAYDSANLSVTSNEVILTVQETNVTTNHAPNIDTVSPTADPTISVGESQTFKITKSDPDGDSMNVTWYVDGISQEDETGDSFTYTASTVGSFIIKVAISDGKASDTNSWALIVESAQAVNQTAPPADKKTGENVTACGDDKCLGGEDQFSCCKDCGCPEGYTCNADTGKCTKERKASNIILLAVVLGLFAGGAGVGLYLYKKKQEQEIFGGLANTPFSLPPKGGEVKKEELIVKKPQEPVKKVEKAQEKPLKNTKTTSQVLLKNFIITNLKKGKSLDQIKKELHKVGWTDEQVNDAYTAAQLDEAFS